MLTLALDPFGGRLLLVVPPTFGLISNKQVVDLLQQLLISGRQEAAAPPHLEHPLCHLVPAGE